MRGFFSPVLAGDDLTLNGHTLTAQVTIDKKPVSTGVKFPAGSAVYTCEKMTYEAYFSEAFKRAERIRNMLVERA